MTLTSETRPVLGWRAEAACASGDHDPDDWFPEHGTDSFEEKKNRALRVCRKCPVQLACLRHALRTEKDIWGIRGGQTSTQRARIRGRLKRLGRRP